MSSSDYKSKFYRLILQNSINVFILFLLISNIAWANLLIFPERVIIKKTDKSTSVILINTTNKKTTYQVKWIQKRQMTNGLFMDLTSEVLDIPSASKLLRFSPHKFTLSEHEKQIIRIILIGKNHLEQGELRSHLTFQAVTDIDSSNFSLNMGPPMQNQMLWSHSIPVIVRQGKLDASAKITSIELKKTVVAMGKMTYNTKVTLNGAGMNTAIGSLKVLWKSKNGNEYRNIGKLNDVTLYPESASVRFHVGLNIQNPSEGSIKVIYLGTQEFEGKIFDESVKRVVKSDFKFEIEK